MALSVSITVTPTSRYNQVDFVSSTGGDLPDEIWLYRANATETGGTFELIAKGIAPDGRFDDHNVTSGEQYLYRAEAHQGASVAQSVIASGVVSLEDTCIHAVTKVSGESNALPGTDLILRVQPPHEHSHDRITSRDNAVDDAPPIADQSDIEEYMVSLDTFTIYDESTRQALEELYDSLTLICYRDPVNPKKFCLWRRFEENYQDIQVRTPMLLEEIYYPERISL